MKKWSLAAIAAVAVMVMTVGSANAATLTANGNRVPGIKAIHDANSWAGEPYADVMGTSITIQREFRRALPSIYSYSQTAHYQDRADMGCRERGTPTPRLRAARRPCALPVASG